MRRLHVRKLTSGHLKSDTDIISLRSFFLRRLKVITSQAISRLSSELKSNSLETCFVWNVKEWQDLLQCASWLRRIAAGVGEMWPAGCKRLYACLQILLYNKTRLFLFCNAFSPCTPRFNWQYSQHSTQIMDHKYIYCLTPTCFGHWSYPWVRQLLGELYYLGSLHLLGILNLFRLLSSVDGGGVSTNYRGPGPTDLKIIARIKHLATQWLMTQNTDFCQQGAQKLVPRYDKCLSYAGNVLEKWWDGGTVKTKLFVLKLRLKSSNICILNLFHDRFTCNTKSKM
jgi:hypothetical protein